MRRVCFDGFTRHSSKCCTTAHEGPDDAMGLGKMFSDPNLLGKLATNPRTQKHLADPSFVKQVWLNNPSLDYTANHLLYRYKPSKPIPVWRTAYLPGATPA